MTAEKTPRGFEHIETWVFDLDNTLYPHNVGLWRQIDDKIRTYVANFLGVSKEQAFEIQKEYYERYGTSMRGLMVEHGMKPDEYLEIVHAIDHSPIEPNPALGAALEKLPGRKLILTNGTKKHAEAVVARLQLHGHFEDVFDIVAAELDPKPSAATYDRFLKAHSVAPERAAMFEDLSRNLAVPHMLGMTTVLIVPPVLREIAGETGRQDWELAGQDAAHVDYVTDDLTGFLGKLRGGL